MVRRIADTLQLRDLKLEVQMLDQRLVSLTNQINRVDRAERARELARYEAERSQLLTQARSRPTGPIAHGAAALTAPCGAAPRAAGGRGQVNQTVGRINEVRQQIQAIERELQLDKYRDADANLRKLIIEKKTRQLVIDDLVKYYKAVDKYEAWPSVCGTGSGAANRQLASVGRPCGEPSAIMSYHRLKMDEVNKIIDDLWRDTYDGGGTPRCHSSSPRPQLTPSPSRRSNPCCVQTLRPSA